MSLIIDHNKQIEGHSWTSQRRLLLDILRDANGHMDAKELYRRASARDDSISQATVYRSLKLFKELGIVDERRLGKVRCYYEIKRHAQHQHLVCKGCDKIIEFQNPEIEELIESIKSEHGFNVTKVDLYLEGYCKECEQRTDNSQLKEAENVLSEDKHVIYKRG